MGHKDRKYLIVEDGTGQAPQNNPVLGDDNGNILPPGQLIIFNKNTDQMKKVDHYRIRFEIEDFSNARLRFTPNVQDVLWVKRGAGAANCPTTSCHHLSHIIWVDEPMHPQGKWIDVINMDLRKEQFWFTLNLVDKSTPNSTNYVPVDPGGGNEDGGGPGSA